MNILYCNYILISNHRFCLYFKHKLISKCLKTIFYKKIVTLIHFCINSNLNIDLNQTFQDYLHYSCFKFYLKYIYNYYHNTHFNLNPIIMYLKAKLIIIFYLFRRLLVPHILFHQFKNLYIIMIYYFTLKYDS